MPVVSFLREKNGVLIIQQAINQTQDGCGFAAVTRSIEYVLRANFADCETPLSLPVPTVPGTGTSLVNFVLWEQDCQSVSAPHYKWTLYDMLNKAWIDGVRLWNNVNLRIHSFVSITPSNGRYPFHPNGPGPTSTGAIFSADLIRENLQFYPIAVFDVFSSYNHDGRAPYTGAGMPTNNHVTGKQESHAVVLVGEFFMDPGEAAIWGVPVGTYFMYQNSAGNQPNSMFPNGISLVCPEVICDLYAIEIVPPLALYRLGHPQPPLPLR